ncbi:hypothetical protein PHMEG_00034503 [Phytophthora megakarya]|uniref:Uncharacterized protein n=1 Tax=Phytophthora megakarya TaxID=4795 RepID=A0A225UQW6_9STRA|nr:hypothetical protein PHMEG_00034503 [Phytophthora megakarya]
MWERSEVVGRHSAPKSAKHEIFTPRRMILGNGQIDLESFTAADFEAFHLEKRKTVGVISLNGFRSAIKPLYRRQEIALPVAYEKACQRVKKKAGYEKSIRRLMRIWKDPLPYSPYQKLCCDCLSRQDGEFNLMCRSESVQTLSSDHLRVHDDSVGWVYHAHDKDKSGGSGPKDPRYMYANPLNAATCWVTVLVIYLACRPTQDSGPLFTGSKQKSRWHLRPVSAVF